MNATDKQSTMLTIAEEHGFTAHTAGAGQIAVEIPWTHISGSTGVDTLFCRTFQQLRDALGY